MLHLSLRFTPLAIGAALSLAFVACSSGGGSSNPLPISTPTPSAPQHLYVSDDGASGQVRIFTLPVTSASLPSVQLAAPNTTAVAVSSTTMVLENRSGSIAVAPLPITSASLPTAIFSNGGAVSSGQSAFSATGSLFASTQSTAVNVFTPPFSNASVPSSTETTGLSSDGLAFDASGNLYIGSLNSTFLVTVPPGLGFSVTAPAGSALRQMAVSATQLAITSVGGAGAVYVYSLPIAAASVPAVTITTGLNAPEGLAFDSAGNLYVGNLGTATITVYTPPFTNASVPTTTLPITGAAIFGIAVGN